MNGAWAEGERREVGGRKWVLLSKDSRDPREEVTDVFCLGWWIPNLHL